MQGTPAGLPWGMPGMAEVMDGAVQHAPQFGRQSMSGMLDADGKRVLGLLAQQGRGPEGSVPPERSGGLRRACARVFSLSGAAP